MRWWILLVLLLVAIAPVSAIDALLASMAPGEMRAVPGTALRDTYPTVDTGIIRAWSSGALDETRNRMVVWGGGHGDSADSRQYVFDLASLTWSRLGTPPDWNGDGTPDYSFGRIEPCGYYTTEQVNVPDDQLKDPVSNPYIQTQYCPLYDAVLDRQNPIARHTYDYIEFAGDTFYTVGASGFYKSGQTSTRRIIGYDYAAGQWFETPASALQGSLIQAVAAYDPVRGTIFFHGQGSWSAGLEEFDPSAGTMTDHGGAMVSERSRTAEVDPVGRYFLEFGNGLVRAWPLPGSGQPVAHADWTTSGGSAIINANAPGVAYHDPSDTIVAWAGGRTVYSFDTSTKVWTPLTATGDDPGAQSSWGTFGRWRYIPSKDAFILVNDVTQPVVIYKPHAELSGGGTDADGDGYYAGADCDDGNASIYPGAAEVCGNGVDEDCSGGDLACPVCGNLVCEAGENVSCPSDCPSEDIVAVGAVAWDHPTPYSVGYALPVLPMTGGADGCHSWPDGEQCSDTDRDSAVSVRYRVQGSSTWTQAYPPLDVEPETIAEGASHREGRTFSGAVWGLSPGTTYEVEFHVTDPDGYDDTFIEVTSTRAEPVDQPAAPNYPCPDGNAADVVDDGAADDCGTLAEARAALAGAVAGSVVRLAPGTYIPDGASTQALLTVSGKTGTPQNPVVLRCADRAATILDGGSLPVTLFIENSDFVTVEDCTIRGGSGWLLKEDSDMEGLVIRRNVFDADVAQTGAIELRNYDKLGFDIIDNQLTGPAVWPSKKTSSYEGIVIHGQGHVIAHNYLSGFGDSIGTSLARATSSFPHRHMNIFGNHIEYAEDDCFEVDYSHANMLIHHNRCENSNSCLSAQPSFGGPTYFFRNLCWSDQTKTVKLQSAADTYGDPGGVHVFNNVLSTPILRYAPGTWNYVELNNLFVGKGDVALISDTSVNLCGPWEPGNPSLNPVHDARQCANHGLLDYAGFSYDGRIDYPPCGDYPSLASFQANSLADPVSGQRCYEHALVPATIFAAITSSDYPDADTTAPVFRTITDPSLSSGSELVDAGTVVPGVTDGYAGSAPDIGALELGDAPYAYGIRDWSGPAPPECGNGVLESGEECDGSAFGSRTCASEGFDAGNLSCTSTCAVNTSACTFLRCDEEASFGQACSAGVGVCAASGTYVCADPASTAEDPVCDAAPGAPGTEICDNLLDDDCDGSVDEGCGVVVQLDFDDVSAVTAPGFTALPITTKNYDAGRGYGWLSGTLGGRDRGNADALGRDFHMSTGGDATFVVDVADGDYTVTVYLQDVSYPGEAFHVDAEGVRVLDSVSADVALVGHSFNVTVADGQLTLDFVRIAAYPRVNGVAVEGRSAPPSCSDGVRNGDETGVDCGGSCAACVAATCAEQSGVACSGFYACPAGSELNASDVAVCCSVACVCANDGDLNCDGIVNVFDLVRAGSPQDRPANWLDRLAAVFTNFGREY